MRFLFISLLIILAARATRPAVAAGERSQAQVQRWTKNAHPKTRSFFPPAAKAPPPPLDPSRDPASSASFRYRFSTQLGLTSVRQTGSALAIGAQMSYAPFKGLGLYIGPEFNYSLFSTGSLFIGAAGVWYELRFSGHALSVLFGALGGMGFNTLLPSLPHLPLAAFLDLGIAHDVDEYTSFCLQFRPGVVAQVFSFQVLTSVTFHFY